MQALAPSRVVLASVLCSLPFAGGCASTPEMTPDEMRARIDEEVDQVLATLEQRDAEARASLEGAPAYAAFSTFELFLGPFGGGGGRGVAVDHTTGERTYLELIQAKAGIGLGGKEEYLVFVFTTTDAFHRFMTDRSQVGRDVGGAAKTRGGRGEAVGIEESFDDDVRMIRMPRSGLQASAGFSGFYVKPIEALETP